MVNPVAGAYAEKSPLAKARDCQTVCLLDVHVASDDVSPASQRVAFLFSQTLKG